MKYNSNNKPLVCMQTQSKCYKNTKTMNVVGILWHSTGANNPNLKRYIQPDDNAKIFLYAKYHSKCFTCMNSFNLVLMSQVSFESVL